MKVVEAKQLVLDILFDCGSLTDASVLVNSDSPDGDPGKFVIDGKVARAIHHYDGWYVPIDLNWFDGGFDQPMINRSPFYWYVFAIPKRNRYLAEQYFVCDYLQMRDWVLDFTAPLGNDHRDHSNWRADLRLYSSTETEHQGYFRWGDESPGNNERLGRVFSLDNIATVAVSPPLGQHVGSFGSGGESAAHNLLKLYVAANPSMCGLSESAEAYVEYSFVTGDRVDVMFKNHLPDRTVVEVEVEGSNNICIGVQQAIKYRSLAAVDAGYPLITPRVRSLVVAYETDYPNAVELADRYDVSLMSVDAEKILASAV